MTPNPKTNPFVELTTLRPMIAKESNACVLLQDLNERCEDFRKFCNKPANKNWMLINCPKTCCQETDFTKQCYEEEGSQCENYKSYCYKKPGMMRMCPITCKFC